MESAQLGYLAKLRVIVGYLGERDRFAWWQSAFFSAGSQAFLAPIFTRTQFLAQCSGVTRAAAAIHDERIGTGHAYHLFRLPEYIEQDIHQMLYNSELSQELINIINNQDQALTFLRQATSALTTKDVGPTRIGDIAGLRSFDNWHMVAAHYLHAFTENIEIYPYFSDPV